jgi:hypothetical protein
VSNVLNEEKKQQVLALGRLGWSLRRIQRATGVRRETVATYLRAAGVVLRPPGRWGRPTVAKPANEVITDPTPTKPANEVITDPAPTKPANEVITDFGAELATRAAAVPAPQPGRSPSASACTPYQEAIAVGIAQGRNARAIWQDLVDGFGFAAGYQSVRRFVRHLQPPLRWKPAPSSRRHPAKRPRWITAKAPWCAIRKAASTAACAYSY